MVGFMVGPTMNPTTGLTGAGHRIRPRSPGLRPGPGSGRGRGLGLGLGLGGHASRGQRPRTDARTEVTRTWGGTCAVRQWHPAQLRVRFSDRCCAAAPHVVTAHDPRPVAQPGCAPPFHGCAIRMPARLRTGGEGGMAGPAMGPTAAARWPCCRIVTGGRGWWPPVWSGPADELTAWNTCPRPPRPGLPPAPPRWAGARCPGRRTRPAPGRRGEPFRGGDPPWRDGR
ncbi:hypothetical protein SAMN05216489_09969 [Streptomyces sp. 3213]|nr:hypothetical protein SAMN05216489_09969 [Streptomyces sp. 3213] [Streptomyces sp. 3213.3]